METGLQLLARITEIVRVGIQLFTKAFTDKRTHLDFVAIHCKNLDEERLLTAQITQLGQVWETTPTGVTYLLYRPLSIENEQVSFIKIRHPDSKSPYLGECDFGLTDWLGFETKNRHKKWLEIIEKETAHLLKYANPDEKVILYFSNPLISQVRENKRPITAIQALLIQDGKLMVVREKDCFLLPGGKPEAGETNEQALRRELTEETNFDLKSAEFFGSYSYPRALTADRPLTLHCYIVQVAGEGKPQAEVMELVWLDKNEYKNTKYPHAWWDPIFADLKERKKIDLI